jgi:polysaccharide chain length determinant protein (PEP-CTERM system associated)
VQVPQNLDIEQLFRACWRRKGLIIAVGLVAFLWAGFLAASLPDVYRSSTLILITPQKLPSSYISSTSTMTVEQRVGAITRQILGRTSLEKIINEFDLFQLKTSGTTMEERVEALRRRVKIEVRRNDIFELAFEASNPEIAMRVTARLAALFIDENLLSREQQAKGTMGFMNAEAGRLRKELEVQEARVNQYKAKYRSELPEQLDANLRALDQLRRELENGLLRFASLQERKAALEQQKVESKRVDRDLTMSGIGTEESSSPSSVSALRARELESLLGKYSEKHPDVVRLKRELEILKTGELLQDTKKPLPNVPIKAGTSLQAVLNRQLNELNVEMESLQGKNNYLRDQIAVIQTRVDNTPVRAMELAKTTRDYDITARKYQDLLAKGLEAELSANMEKNQKGEQFQVVDPASFPEKPVAPQRRRIVLMGLALGLMAGIGLVLLSEMLDTSLKRVDEVESLFGIPILAAIPAVATRGVVLQKRQAQGVLVLASVTSLIVGVGAIRLYLLGRFF